MLRVKLKDIDVLGEILAQLEVVTYLQDLLLYDKDGKSALAEDFSFVHRDAQNYLWDWQLDTVLQYKRLIEKEDFMM